MPTPTNKNDRALSVCLRRELRLALEAHRLRRGQREEKLPSLRTLIEEAVEALLEKEAVARVPPSANKAAP